MSTPAKVTLGAAAAAGVLAATAAGLSRTQAGRSMARKAREAGRKVADEATRMGRSVSRHAAEYLPESPKLRGEARSGRSQGQGSPRERFRTGPVSLD